jgi:carbon storage regulator
MLVLTRKKEQTLVIGDDIEVTVLEIQGEQIRLGVKAPKSVKVYRKELYLEIQEENKSAAKASAPHVPPVIKDLLKSGAAGATGVAGAINAPATAVAANGIATTGATGAADSPAATCATGATGAASKQGEGAANYQAIISPTPSKI